MVDISSGLNLSGTLKRNSANQSASGAWPDNFAPIQAGVRCRISQPGAPDRLIGFQEVSDLEAVVLFMPGEDVREHDRIEITGGEQPAYVGTEWDLRGIVAPSRPVYKRATGRRIQTAAS